MTRVRFFVTGRTEEALPAAFSRLFPNATFTAQRVEGFTSSRLDPQRVPERVGETLGDLVGAVQRNGGADYALLVDDLELANVGRVAEVASYFRNGANALATTRSRPTIDRLRYHVSVHLLAPMIEAYFFCDPSALAAAGVTARPIVSAGAPEHFHTSDPAFLAPPTSRDVDWQHGLRCVHPKYYLVHLLERVGSTYAETTLGRAALAATDLRTAWAQQGAVWSLVGALVDDVADMVGVQSPTPSRVVAPTAGPGTVLRNL